MAGQLWVKKVLPFLWERSVPDMPAKKIMALHLLELAIGVKRCWVAQTEAMLTEDPGNQTRDFSKARPEDSCFSVTCIEICVFRREEAWP